MEKIRRIICVKLSVKESINFTMKPHSYLPKTISNLEKTISSVSNTLHSEETSLSQKFYALDILGAITEPESVHAIESCLSDDSVVIKHKALFRLGQICYHRPGSKASDLALPLLYDMLSKNEEHLLVRHEAGEMLGGLGLKESISHLQLFLNDLTSEVAETCELAIRQIEWINNNLDSDIPMYHGDAAPASNETDIGNLADVLLDQSTPTWDQFRAMFALRNIGTQDAQDILVKAMGVSKNALVGHDIAYILTNIPSNDCIDVLYARLSDCNENVLVRHVCGEALAEMDNKHAHELARQFLNDDDIVIRESVEGALYPKL